MSVRHEQDLNGNEEPQYDQSGSDAQSYQENGSEKLFVAA